jgi:nitrite reductase/ring-hydroxylating ferredoxin subunit
MDYIRLAKVSDFDNTRIKSYRIFAKLVAIVKDADGTFWATEIACKHQYADLTEGRFKGDCVTCPRHGWIYNIRTGLCLNQNSATLRRYGLKQEGSDLYVSVAPLEDGYAEIPPDEPPPVLRRRTDTG